MLKELFESSFYYTFPRKEDTILILDEFTARGDFALVDESACKGCKFVCSDNPKKREQLRVYGDQQVSYVSLDQVFNYVREDVGQISDFFFFF